MTKKIVSGINETDDPSSMSGSSLGVFVRTLLASVLGLMGLVDCFELQF